MRLEGKNALVLGLGLSGLASALKLAELGASVTASDSDDSDRLREGARSLEKEGIRCVLGSHPLELLDGCDLLVVSPGVPASNPLLLEAAGRGVPVWSEIELAWRFVRVPVIAVTGTNGKTTTVHMIEAILRRAGRRVKVAGNIGYPMVKAVDEMEGCELLLLEVSSFQLAHIVEFTPHVAVILNIRDDHFDWHQDLEEYVRAKARIWLNQGPEDFIILNLDDVHGAEAGRMAPSRHVYFSSRPDSLAEVCVSRERMVSRLKARMTEATGQVEVMRTDELPLPGRHNLENAMAAAAACLALEVPARAVREALTEFEGLPHRIQFTAEIGGVRYYDDSKATNPDAALRAVQSFDQPLVPIMGGRNKGLDFTELAGEVGKAAAVGKVRGAVLMGEAAPELEKALSPWAAKINKEVVWDMREAVEAARRMALPGDAVVLTPACASFDQYGSYAERGDHYQHLVRSLAEKG